MYRIAAIICSVTITITSALGMAVPFSYLPYVPPSNGRIMDYIFNSYGVTALEYTDEETKFEKYMGLYRAVLGSAYDNFYADLMEAINNSKTSRQIVLKQSLRDALRLGIKQSINEGIVTEAQESLESKQALVDWFNSDATPFGGMTLQLLNLGNFWQYYGENTIYAFFKGSQYGYLYAFAMEPKTKGMKIIMNGSRGYYVPIGSTGNVRCVLYNMSGNTVTSVYIGIEYPIPDSGAFADPMLSDVFNINLPATTQVMEAQNTTVQQAINDELAEVATPVMILYPNGTIDITYPTVIDLPSSEVVPATDPEDIAAVQQKLGVLPISEETDAETVKQQLEQSSAAKYGDAKEYALDLTRYFPFCLPFDVSRILVAFIAEPEAPSFTYTINNPFSEDTEDDIVLEIDLAIFDDLAAVLRTLETILFVVGLAVVTRSLYLRG